MNFGTRDAHIMLLSTCEFEDSQESHAAVVHINEGFCSNIHVLLLTHKNGFTLAVVVCGSETGRCL